MLYPMSGAYAVAGATVVHYIQRLGFRLQTVFDLREWTCVSRLVTELEMPHAV